MAGAFCRDSDALINLHFETLDEARKARGNKALEWGAGTRSLGGYAPHVGLHL